MYKLLYLAVFFVILSFQSCEEPKSPNEISDNAMILAHDSKDYLLTEDEAREALHIMIKKSEIRRYGSLSADSKNDSFDSEDFRHGYDNYEYNENDYLYDEYVTIKIAKQWENFEFTQNWECNLKDGLFRKIEGNAYSFNSVHGRFIKDKNGEWIAIIVSSIFLDGTH